MTEEIKKAQEHLVALETFLKSSAHAGYVIARQYDIAQLEDAIVAVEPIDRPSEIEGFKLRGELRSQHEMLTTFEDAKITLKKRIDTLLEQETENQTTKV